MPLHVVQPHSFDDPQLCLHALTCTMSSVSAKSFTCIFALWSTTNIHSTGAEVQPCVESCQCMPAEYTVFISTSCKTLSNRLQALLPSHMHYNCMHSQDSSQMVTQNASCCPQPALGMSIHVQGHCNTEAYSSINMHVDSGVSGFVSVMALITHGNSEALSLPLLQV